jgi:hypothetical protein
MLRVEVDATSGNGHPEVVLKQRRRTVGSRPQRKWLDWSSKNLIVLAMLKARRLNISPGLVVQCLQGFFPMEVNRYQDHFLASEAFSY